MAGLNQQPVATQAETLAQMWADGILRSYSQVLFSSSRAVGILLLAATLVDPIMGLMGLATALVGLVTARLMGLSEASFRNGLLTFNSVLVGLGLGAMFEPTPMLFMLVPIAGVATLLLTVALSAAMASTLNLPVLTLPFILSMWILHALVGGLSGLEPALQLWDSTALSPLLPPFLSSFFKALGALFFLPRVDAGILVAVALLASSRIGFLLSAVGFGVAYVVSIWLTVAPTAPLVQNVGFNLMLVSIALGGIWFVPCWSSFFVASLASVLAAVFAVAFASWAPVLGLAPLTLPFVVTVLLVLVAMRLRSIDSAPKSVDFTPGSPEQNLDYYQTRLARFGTPLPVAIGLPFMGRWTCTQGNDGQHTHQGSWRHGLDFEVRGVDGNTFLGDGLKTENYLCWRLPVTAVADGTVVRVVNDVPDNPIGEMTSPDNWGNLVLVYHAPGIYSLVAHLAEGSVTVQRGSVLRRGATVGLCGNSGRSLVPHVHLQLQSNEVIGSPTRPIQLSDVVVVDPQDGETLVSRSIPVQGQTLRNLARDESMASLCGWPMGEPLKFRVEIGGVAHSQTVVPEMDLLGAKHLACSETHDLLWYEDRLGMFTIYDQVGRRDSLLGMMRMAMPKVPFDPMPGLRWSDSLILGQTRSGLHLALRDFVAPFIGTGGMPMVYRFEQQGECWCVLGHSLKKRRSGEPVVETRASLLNTIGLQSLEVRVDGKQIRASRIL